MKEKGARGKMGPAAAIKGEAAAGNDAMNVRMKDESLSPCVKNGEEADRCTELGSGDVDKRLASRAQQNRVEQLRRMKDQRVEPVGNGEDDVEVRDVEHFLAPLFEPESSGFTAAARTMTIAAGVPEDVLVLATVTPIAMTA
jgi:hypothetical protein